MMMKEILEIRKNRYAKDIEELEYGLICIGTPIFNQKKLPIAAISVSGPITRMTAVVQKRITQRLVEASNSISDKLSSR